MKERRSRNHRETRNQRERGVTLRDKFSTCVYDLYLRIDKSRHNAKEPVRSIAHVVGGIMDIIAGNNK